ncbi:S-adenosyl-L-methionine-dependent methyltransferase [Thozetella sp. PMI_491]|nr:S-adenosyl-L-methionine-dependent methyltransferase [Thozetella sp. PMI_491]
MATAPEETQQRIELDPEVVADDGDSAIDEESIRGSTASLTSSILEYRSINGRTYQSSKTTEYWAPNDEKHLESFDIAHQWVTMMLGDKLYVAPIGDNPHHILDLGTGSGIWAIDVADKFPSAEVIGTDISATQPSWIPPNLTFQIDDAQLDWTFKEDYFDFIHIRYLQGAINDWPKLYAQVYKHLKPGGWFQHMDPDIELRSEDPSIVIDKDHIYQKWARLFYDAGDKLGRTFKFANGQMEEWARGAGFEDITHKKYKVPFGTWPKDKKTKELGAYIGLFFDVSLDGFAIYPIGQILGWTLDEVQVLVAEMRSAVRNPKNMTVGDVHVVYGRKPEKPTT